MTANNPSMEPAGSSLGTTPLYRAHDMQQLGSGTVGNDQAPGNTQQQPGIGANPSGFRSIGDFASSGNYAGGTGNDDRPLDVKQAQFNNQPYLRRPFGPQEM